MLNISLAFFVVAVKVFANIFFNIFCCYNFKLYICYTITHNKDFIFTNFNNYYNTKIQPFIILYFHINQIIFYIYHLSH